MRGGGWSALVTAVTGRHIVPPLPVTDNGPGRGQACHNSSFISTSVPFVTFVTLINTIVSSKAFREHLRPNWSFMTVLSGVSAMNERRERLCVTSFDRFWVTNYSANIPQSGQSVSQTSSDGDQSEVRTVRWWPIRGRERVRSRQGLWQLRCSVLFPWHWVMGSGNGNKRNKLVTCGHKCTSDPCTNTSREIINYNN